MIHLDNLCKSYQSQAGYVDALLDIHLTVAPGEICGVIGRSGAGKSTLIRCVNLLERPTSGCVIVNGQNLLELSAIQLRQARHHIGMIFQHFNLLSSRTVFKNVAFQLELLGYKKQAIEQAVLPLLELTGLADKRDSYPSELSGGQKQRVAIARALITKPKVLLCDEMTSALDPETTRSILGLVKKINIELGLSILLITHEMHVIKSIADHVIVLDRGQIVEDTDVINLFKSPQSSVAKQFVSHDFHGHIPEELQNQIHHTPTENSRLILQITFIGETATQPVIEQLIHHSKVHINIMQADLEYLRKETIGTMTVTLTASHDDCQQAITYLRERGVGVEVLGYVD